MQTQSGVARLKNFFAITPQTLLLSHYSLRLMAGSRCKNRDYGVTVPERSSFLVQCV
jgi:hypothetical protein